MSENGQPQHEQSPPLPWEIVYRNSVTYIEPREDGDGFTLTFVPCAATPGGLSLMPPGIKIMFNAGGWEGFKREVAADGNRPKVEIARSMPLTPPE